MGRSVSLFLASSVCAAAAACSTAADQPEPTPSAPSTAGWHAPDPEPPSYAFTLNSSCGERAGLGVFRIRVEQHRPVEVRALGRWSDTAPRPAAQTLDRLAELAVRMEGRADEVTVRLGSDGLVERLVIDRIENAIDDEECYAVSNLRMPT
ncbi:MAG: DUF6174 domain-containing protein [Nocardioidaceae bacterium]